MKAVNVRAMGIRQVRVAEVNRGIAYRSSINDNGLGVLQGRAMRTAVAA